MKTIVPIKYNLLSFSLFIFFLSNVFSQGDSIVHVLQSPKKVEFQPHPDQRFGFDNSISQANFGLDSLIFTVPIKVVSPTQGDVVLLHIKGLDSLNKLQLKTTLYTNENLTYQRVNDSTLRIDLPASSYGYEVSVLYENYLYGMLNVIIYEQKNINLTIIPHPNLSYENQYFSKDSIEKKLNYFLNVANVHCTVSIQQSYKENLVSFPLELPEENDFLSFSSGMTKLSKLYKDLPQETYRVFLVPSFLDSTVDGYAAFGNNSIFITSNTSKFVSTLLTQLARSVAFLPDFEYQPYTLPKILSQSDWQNLHEGAACKLTWKEAQLQKGTAGLVSYHFWEEDNQGYINRKTFSNPYKRNYSISISARIPKLNVPLYQVEKAVMLLSHTKGTELSKSQFEIKNSKNEIEVVEIPLSKKQANILGSQIFIKKNGLWEATPRKQVLYFNVLNDSLLKFSHANDSVVLDKYNVAHYANGHFLVYTHWKSNGKIAKQEVYSYQGELVTDYFIKPQYVLPKRVLVFSNGYRGPDKNGDVSDHLVSTRDRYYYWMGIDTAFKRRLNATETLYIDGNHGIGTSSHQNMLNFGLSIAMVKTIARHDDYSILNTKPNVEGFEERRKQGQIAGKAYLVSRCSFPGCLEKKDTVDIVAHSMGYAYALGFMDALDGKVVFGKIYILAPENACVGGFDWSKVEEVWQYGSNLDQANPDPVWEQDGIAPQCQVKGLEKVDKNKGGRAFIPKDWPHKNFVDSHMLNYYFWIFDRIKKGEPGYINR